MLRRPLSMGGWLPIPLTEIQALEHLLKLTLRPVQLDALLRLDHVWLTVSQEKGHSFEDDP